LFGCKSCGEPGYGLTGGKIAKRTCLNCNKSGCEKCLPLIAITKSSNNRYISISNREIYDREGYCSIKCLKNAIIEGNVKLEQKIFQEKSRDLLEEKYVYEYFLDDYEILDNFQEDFYKIIVETDNLQKFEHVLNNYSKNSCLAQGLLTMFEGHKKLEYKKIIKGLQLCRNDAQYHNDDDIHDFVNDLAKEYIDDLKLYDVPTSKMESGNISITLTMPKDKKEMKIFSCPGCGSPLNKVVLRGQVVKCDHCGGVFEVV